MGLFSSVGGFCSSVASGISSAVSSIGSALSSFATGVGTVIGGVIEALAPAAKGIGMFANAFLQGLGVIKPNEKVENIGDRALQAAEAGITIDKFDDFDEYMENLRNFELDSELSEKYPVTQKIVAGLGVGTVGVERKFDAEPGSLGSMWLLPMANPGYFTPERMQGLVSAEQLGGDVFAYLEKRLTGGEARSIEKKLELDQDGNVLGATNRTELYEALENAQDNWSDMMDKINKNQ